jgi:hypothetical protein
MRWGGCWKGRAEPAGCHAHGLPPMGLHIMKHAGWLALILLAGCSTHPVGDMLDYFKPGKLYSDGKTVPYGGVCQNQGPVLGPGAGGPPQINVGPPAPLGPVVPPPVPITAPVGPGGPTVPPPPPPPTFPR